eukprot:comp21423_c1_seq1/m.29533 comp21423_c1_seq1/g.29533  ORF comp21423_c1_seq1/g.29533 comp21423_c1_seq1/m.29533 type:complete len:352 (-) comp21423_c1_seq1:601-1656(-)
MAETPEFDPKMHIAYFRRCMQMLPEPYKGQDHNRLTLLFFCLSGLDVLNGLELGEEERAGIVDWIYSLQVVPDKDDPDKNAGLCGFRGSNWLGMPFETSGVKSYYPNDCSHITMTYCALLLLITLGDDLSRVSRKAIVESLRGLQLEDGSFTSTVVGGESDLRFLYCACVISTLLDDWSGVDRERAIKFIRGSMSYECAFGQGPNLEAHGGSTFCAVASMVLLGGTDGILTNNQVSGLQGWLINRQQTGFQGRPGKPTDSCYSFWVGASLEMLGVYDWVDKEANAGFLRTCQFAKYGGFGKWPDSYPDVLHAYFSVCGFSLMGYEGLKKLNCPLNISEKAYLDYRRRQGTA